MNIFINKLNKYINQAKTTLIPNGFLQLIVINHVICFCKDKILEIWISINEEFQLTTLNLGHQFYTT